MKLGVDVRPLQATPVLGGVGIYTRRLVESLILGFPEHHFVLTVWPDIPAPDLDCSGQNWEFRPATAGPASTWLGAAWRAMRADARVDVGGLSAYLQTDIRHGVPRGCPVVCTAYDMIPLLFRRWYAPNRPPIRPRYWRSWLALAGRWILFRFGLRSYRLCHTLLAISETTRDDFIALVGGLPDIVVCPLAAFRGDDEQRTAPRAAPTKPFILYVGGTDPRKRPELLLAAFAEVRAIEDVQLALVGGGGTRERLDLTALLPPAHRDDVVVLGSVSVEELRWLYANATVLASASAYEGFGLPILEAMQMGCPVVAYANSAIAEVADSAAVLFEEGQPLSPAILKVMRDAHLREELSVAGRQRAQQFRWPDTAERTMSVLVAAAG